MVYERLLHDRHFNPWSHFLLLKGKGVVMSPLSHRLAGAPVTKLLKGTTGAARYMWHLIRPSFFLENHGVFIRRSELQSSSFLSKKVLHTPSQTLVVND